MSLTFKIPDITPARDSGEGSKTIMILVNGLWNTRCLL